MAVAERVCSLEGCPANTGGECLEGHAQIDECPNFDAATDEDQAPAAVAAAPLDAPHVELWSGDALLPEEANAIVAGGRSTTVLLAGEAESGKTTLLAALFERYLDGPYAGLRFSGSRTLGAFEERCFLARVASGRTQPTTKRTALTDQPRLIHLELQSETDGRSHDLLAVDVAGERFTAVRNNNEAWSAISVMDSMDRVVFLFDGARLADPTLRQETISGTRQLMRSAIETGSVPVEIADVTVTKWDLVVRAGEDAVKSANEALTRYGEMLGRDPDSFVKTAARSEIEEVAAGLGLDSLLENWLRARSDRPSLPTRIESPVLTLPFDRFRTTAEN
jgi:hypothetical protein